jgi:hypothetical protein
MNIKIVLVTVVALVAAAGLALGVVNNITLNHKITALHHTVTSQQKQLRETGARLSGDETSLSQLEPLIPFATGSWYSMQGTDSFGNYDGQTFYMPATTTPQP